MNSLATIRTINGHKQSLLKESGYKSIIEAKRDYDFEGSDNDMFEILRDNYNGIIEQLQQQKRKLLIQQKNKNKSFLKDFNVEDETIRPTKENRKANYENKSFLKDFNVEDEDNNKIEKKTERKERYEMSSRDKFLVINIPTDNRKCLKAIKDKYESDTMFAFRNLMTRRNNKVNIYSFEVNSIQDMKNKLISLYKQQKNAFKISIQFGFVFEMVLGETQAYLVYDATTKKFYKEAILITNMKQLQILMNSFNIEDITTYVDSMRPSSGHKTIGITTLDVKIFDMNYRIGASIELPDFVLKNQSINSMSDSVNNMCFWNCLAFHNTKARKCYSVGKQLYEAFYKTKANKSYLGFDIHNELVKFEQKFKIGVYIFELDEENKFIETRHSEIEDNKMNLLLVRNHFCYIRDLENIEGTKFKCDKCGHLFEDITHLKRHNCKDFVKQDKFVKFPQVYEPKRNLIIDYNEIFGTECDFKYEPVIVFDFESKLVKVDKKTSKNMSLINKHVAVSVSIYSNVEGYDTEIFLVNEDPKQLIKEMFQVFQKITEKAVETMEEKFQVLYDKIEELLPETKAQKRYTQQLDRYVQEVPILGFNSGMYDINLNITEFINEMKNTKITAIKNGNTYKALIGGNFRFLDICQYIPPGFNLDKYITAFNPNGMKKSVFPYEYIDSFEKLNENIDVLSRKHFFSSLKNKGITDKEWEEFKENKIKYEWKTIKDLLKYYNNLDVKPFLEAVLNHRQFFYDLNIDMLKDGFSLPAIAEKIEFYYELKEFNEEFINVELYPNYKLNNYENSTIRLSGYKVQDIDKKRFDEEAFIEEKEVSELICNQGGKCKYCWKKCKTENWSLDRINNNFGHNSGNCVLSCIECNKQRSDELYQVFYRKKALVRYSYNHPLIYLIDEENKEAFYKLKENITGGASIVFHRFHEADKTRIKRPVYEDGEWKEGKEGKTVKNITGFDANALYLWATGRDMLCGKLKYEVGEDFDIENDFGMVEVDIETPEELKNDMGEFPLIFKNIEYDANEQMGEYMETLYDDKKEKRMTRKLISSFKGEKILIKSDRLKWLVSKGLIVTKIHGYIKAQRAKIFSGFVEAVSNFRRLGDRDPKYAIIAEMWKNVGNSAFGRSGMNKNKFYNTLYGDEEKYNKEVGSFLFRDANEYGEIYEITKDKMKTTQNIPIQVACSIYDDSKLRMSEFYYDCVSKYISKEDFQYIEMDTDSAYMALTGDFNDLVKPEMKEEFLKDKNNWFLRDDTPENNAFDKRVSGLFKPEFIGAGIVAENSKTYYVKGFGDKDKMSCKGIQKSNNDITFELYKRVLFEKEKHLVKNKGFRILNDKQTSNEIVMIDGKEKYINNNQDQTQKGRAIYMYEVEKVGLTAKYDKRRVLNDKVSTVPLDI
jgi:hypothetical protein